jgi:hypothetical protein
MFWLHARSYNLNLVASKKIIPENMATLGVFQGFKKSFVRFAAGGFFFFFFFSPLKWG